MGTVLWILIYAGLFYFMMRYGCCGMSYRSHTRRATGNGDSSHSGHGAHSGGGASTDNDPVCGMSVNPDDGYRLKYHEREYRFCSRNCLGSIRKRSRPIRNQRAVGELERESRNEGHRTGSSVRDGRA